MRPNGLSWAFGLAMALIGAAGAAPDAAAARDKQRAEAEALKRDGNFQEAFDRYAALAVDPAEDPRSAGTDLDSAVACLRSLNRIGEADALREKVAGIHAAHWRVLWSVARSYYDTEHYGTVVGGRFTRGSHRGGQARYVNTQERDRVRALQLMEKARTQLGALAAGTPDAASDQDLGAFYVDLARMWLGYRGQEGAWRLQALTDLSQLPDFEEGGRYEGYGEAPGAPVDADGNPVFHRRPRRYEEAASDGERWRESLELAMQVDPERRAEARLALAQFLNAQFGVQTMADYGWAFRRAAEDESAALKTFAIHTLAEDETMARLATGIRRFRLPDEFNFLRLYRQVADDPTAAGLGQAALHELAGIYENRRQYPQAAECWKRSIKTYGVGNDHWKQKRLDQIVGNWGRFEPVGTHPAGREAAVEFRYRNARRVTFQAEEINVRQLLDDIRDYLASNPRELDWERMQIENIGYMLVEKDQAKYLAGEAGRWALDLNPRPNHVDRLVTVKTPLTRAGAYLVTATVEDGNVSKIVLWVNDTVLMRKPLDGKVWFYAADAVNGDPLAHVDVDFFGYRQEPVKSATRRHSVLTRRFSERSDAEGQVLPSPAAFDSQYTWLVTVATESGRLAYLGFSDVWYGSRHEAEYNATKVYGITDRPVYRPDQPVRFKFWIRTARYDQEDVSSFAHEDYAVIVTNPKGDKVFEKTFTTDAFAGLDGEFTLPKDAALGSYYAYLWKGGSSMGGVHFRVEEYKKPEFEVTVDAPAEPVMLGDTIKATIKAAYYYGAPVKQAKVTYTIKRSSTEADWYPEGRWDWFYGPGYGWFSGDYSWYPGWREWGCRAPVGGWWPVRRDPPELIARHETTVGEDGTVAVAIDTALAKALHDDTDHRYEITAEVTDASRRTIVGQGAVLVARRPFKVYAWVDRGHYRVGDTVRAEFSARTLDRRPVPGTGALTLYRVTYRDGEAVETAVQTWPLEMGVEGRAQQSIQASQAGQYRLSCRVRDARGNEVEGGYVYLVRGEGFDGREFRFNQLELTPDRREYAPGETVRLMINVDKPGATVLLFARPANGVYLPPKVLRLTGKSIVETLDVTPKDMPNFFVEAVAIYDGAQHTQVREIMVPPEQRVLNVDVQPSATAYKPGETASVRLKVTDLFGKPYAGSLALSVYDKALEYISGGANVPEIRAFFWKWRRHHSPQTESSLARQFHNLAKSGVAVMENVGIFGETGADDFDGSDPFGGGLGGRPMKKAARRFAARPSMQAADAVETLAMAPAPMAAAAGEESAMMAFGDAGGAGDEAQPAIRKAFADTAFWKGTLMADADGNAVVTFPMPENLTGWKIRTWAMGHGTKVGEGSAEIVTAKNLLLRLQAPRFFVEKDEVVLSANIHNYLKTAKSVRAVLELDGGCLEAMDAVTRTVRVEAGGEQRVDWRVRAAREGEAVVRMKALSDEESDAMEMRFPVRVHGMLKTDSFCGVIRPDGRDATVTIVVPERRRVEASVLEIRYSPSLAGALVDALPYLVDYPYGCTEQTLNRFLPAAMVQKILKDMGIDLKAIREKRTNLNAQELGDDRERAAQWKRTNPPNPGVDERQPVFDEAAVAERVRAGIKALTEMQLTDGGWGWFSGYGERSWPHTTAYVVHGLQMARGNGLQIPAGVVERGVDWLARYQQEELRKLRNAPRQQTPWKESADDLDAFIHMVLADAGRDDPDMRDALYRDRTRLSVYAKAMLALALVGRGQDEKLDMLRQNLRQYLVRDEENQTVYFNLGNAEYWWHWYGSENEAHAYYLKLLARTDPRNPDAAGLVKYLLNNRKHATYWNSTRDTALCIEALADYLRASGEDKPDMTVEVLIDGKKRKEARITADNLFSFDNRLVLEGTAVEAGRHTVELRRSGRGPVYFNVYLTNFTLEDPIAKAGLEIKVERRFYKLTPLAKTAVVAGVRGQALGQQVDTYQRTPLAPGALLKSGDLVEIELEIASKNDCEYVVFEDMKAAGFEPVEVRSGYNGNDLGAYVEFRDERVCFFARVLPRGRHSVAYRLRAEIPGRFSALPTRAFAMYAPELKANSDEMKVSVED